MRFEGLVLNKPVNMRRCKITSRFWSIRKRKWGWGKHGGYDFAPDPECNDIPLATRLSGQYKDAKVRVYSSIYEEVVKVDYERDGFGNYVKTQVCGFPIYLYYAHLAEIFVQKGQVLIPSQYLGLMGNSGFVYSTSGGDGTHLHHEGREIRYRDNIRPFDLAAYYKDNDLEAMYPEYEKIRG